MTFEIEKDDSTTLLREIIPIVDNYEKRHARKAGRANTPQSREFHKAKSLFAIEWLNRANLLLAVELTNRRLKDQ